MAFWEIFSLENFILIALLFIAAYVAVTWNNDYFSKRNIPHHKPVLLLGSMSPAFFQKRAFADLTLDLYKSFPDRKFCGLFQFMTPQLMIRDPQLLKQVTVKDFEHFTDHINVIPEAADPIVTANLFTRRGHKWRHMRNILSPAFTSSKMKAMFVFMSQCGKQLAEHVEEKLRESGDESISVEMKDMFTRYTSDVIATCAFGLECNSLKDRNNEFYLIGKNMANIGAVRTLIIFAYMMFPNILGFFRIPVLPPRCTKFLTSLVKDTIKTREQEGIVRPDMLHLLMQARKGELKDDEQTDGTEPKAEGNVVAHLTDLEIASQAMVFFLAGYETASTLLCFTSLLLAMHPEVQHRLHEEIDRTLEENDGEITYEALHGMKYLDMVVSESLRLYPPVAAVDRECTRPYRIAASDGHPSVSFNLKERILVPIYAIHRDPQYYPDPEKFAPERFSDENKHKIQPFTYMPFGLGPRTCIGNRLALLEDKIALISILGRFRFDIVEKSPVPIQLTTKEFNMTVDGGFWIGIKRRL